MPEDAALPDLDLDLDVLAETALPADLDLDALRNLVAFALEAEGAGGPWRVAVALVDDDRLRELHLQFMGIDEATDVMTFPADEPGIGGGDIAVSVDRAAEQGPAFGHTAAEEIAFLVVHGLLHLLGWDDPTAETRAAMLQRQALLIGRFRARARAG
jgi:rRNA maturation RNase YbeY